MTSVYCLASSLCLLSSFSFACRLDDWRAGDRQAGDWLAEAGKDLLWKGLGVLLLWSGDRLYSLSLDSDRSSDRRRL